ncbi:MAG: hypothetical protein H6909_01255 [Rickettsiaceae bacterium]|nr:hypothetical protein [Rickettsiaceae bacterium]
MCQYYATSVAIKPKKQRSDFSNRDANKNDFNEVRVVVEDFVSEPYNKIGPVKEESVDENSTSNEVIYS